MAELGEQRGASGLPKKHESRIALLAGIIGIATGGILLYEKSKAAAANAAAQAPATDTSQQPVQSVSGGQGGAAADPGAFTLALSRIEGDFQQQFKSQGDTFTQFQSDTQKNLGSLSSQEAANAAAQQTALSKVVDGFGTAITSIASQVAGNQQANQDALSKLTGQFEGDLSKVQAADSAAIAAQAQAQGGALASLAASVQQGFTNIVTLVQTHPDAPPPAASTPVSNGPGQTGAAPPSNTPPPANNPPPNTVSGLIGSIKTTFGGGRFLVNVNGHDGNHTGFANAGTYGGMHFNTPVYDSSGNIIAYVDLAGN